MHRLLIGKREIQERPATYYLLTDEIENLYESYGVAIQYGEREQASIPRITFSQNKIFLLIAALMRYTVTPVSLRDVVEDWLLQ